MQLWFSPQGQAWNLGGASESFQMEASRLGLCTLTWTSCCMWATPERGENLGEVAPLAEGSFGRVAVPCTGGISVPVSGPRRGLCGRPRHLLYSSTLTVMLRRKMMGMETWGNDVTSVTWPLSELEALSSLVSNL